jgi:uncharacterized membrane protein YczE
VVTRGLSPGALGRLAGAHLFVGAGIALVLRSGLGAAPWDLFHVGLARASGLSVGVATAATSVAALLVALLLGVRPGIGTVINALLIGACIDGALALAPAAPTFFQGLVYQAAGLVLVGLGTGLYLAARLGAGPRDSLMLALARRLRWSPGRARLALELSALGAGVSLGGRVGVGTLVYVLLIGPLVGLGIRLFAEAA